MCAAYGERIVYQISLTDTKTNAFIDAIIVHYMYEEPKLKHGLMRPERGLRNGTQSKEKFMRGTHLQYFHKIIFALKSF